MDLINISVGASVAYSLLGFAIVFVGLIFLMIVIKIMEVVMGGGRKKAATAAAPASAAPQGAKPLAPGSAGEIKLHDVPDKEAAMVMAIVANKMNKPLNELRFKSIKEVKKDEV